LNVDASREAESTHWGQKIQEQGGQPQYQEGPDSLGISMCALNARGLQNGRSLKHTEGEDSERVYSYNPVARREIGNVIVSHVQRF